MSTRAAAGPKEEKMDTDKEKTQSVETSGAPAQDVVVETAAEGTNLSDGTVGGIGAVSEIANRDEGNWRMQIPRDIRDAECFRRFKSQKDLYRAYAELVGLDGKRLSGAPAKKDGEVPEEDYGDLYAEADGLPAGMRESMRSVFDEFRRSGIRRDGVDRLLKSFNSVGELSAQQAAKARRDACSKELKRLWGDEAEANGRRLEEFRRTGLPKESLEALERSGAFDNPYVVDLMVRIQRGGEEAHTPNGGSGARPKTMEDAIHSFFV